MREIKFRAWDKTENRMARNVEDLLFNSKGLYGVVLNHMGFAFRRRVKDVVLMQFTGLKDKNGKEIYGGDIARVNNTLYVVVFVQGAFVLSDTENLNANLQLLSDQVSFVEVIGNIHENLELLEVE